MIDVATRLQSILAEETCEEMWIKCQEVLPGLISQLQSVREYDRLADGAQEGGAAVSDERPYTYARCGCGKLFVRWAEVGQNDPDDVCRECKAALTAPSPDEQPKGASDARALPDLNPTLHKGVQGVYRKFDVKRTDGDPTGKHAGCEYFVLDTTHDEHARAALAAYADSCAKEYPVLADDMRIRYGLPADRATTGARAASDGGDLSVFQYCVSGMYSDTHANALLQGRVWAKRGEKFFRVDDVLAILAAPSPPVHEATAPPEGTRAVIPCGCSGLSLIHERGAEGCTEGTRAGEGAGEAHWCVECGGITYPCPRLAREAYQGARAPVSRSGDAAPPYSMDALKAFTTSALREELDSRSLAQKEEAQSGTPSAWERLTVTRENGDTITGHVTPQYAAQAMLMPTGDPGT